MYLYFLTLNIEFQVILMERFHCVLMAKIPTFPFSHDHISVSISMKNKFNIEML